MKKTIWVQLLHLYILGSALASCCFQDHATQIWVKQNHTLKCHNFLLSGTQRKELKLKKRLKLGNDKTLMGKYSSEEFIRKKYVGTSVSQQMLTEIRLMRTASKVNLAVRKLRFLKIKSFHPSLSKHIATSYTHFYKNILGLKVFVKYPKAWVWASLTLISKLTFIGSAQRDAGYQGEKQSWLECFSYITG